MRSKRFLPAFFILCVLLVGCAFAASSEQPKDNVPFTVKADDLKQFIILHDGSEKEFSKFAPLYAVLMGVGEERGVWGVIVSPDIVSGDIVDRPTTQHIRWTTNNWGVAKIAGQENEGDAIENSQVLVEARGSGTATITATSVTDPTVSETLTVYVQNSPVPVEKVLINKEEIGILSGYTDELTASVMPPHADVRHVTWHSSNSSIVAIDPATRTGNRVRLLTAGLHTGTAYISAVSNYSGGRGGARPAAVCVVRHYVEGPRSTEGGCSAVSTSGLIGLLLIAPLLIFLKK